ARASAQLDVRGCAVRRPFINAPREVDVGVPFTASVFLEAGESAHWTVTNAAVDTNTGGLIEVRADREGEVGLAVRVERDASCFAEGFANIAARVRPAECPVAPTAHVELGDTTCGSATIRVTFTGTPPFRGKWSDGEPFASVTDTMTRTVHWSGPFRIAEVRDATGCIGTSSGSAMFEAYRAGVTLETSGSCAGARVIAKFSGTPPFSGIWSTGESFTTSDNELALENVPFGHYFIHSFRDSVCPSNHVTSNRVDVGVEPVLTFNRSYSCSDDVRQRAFVTYRFAGAGKGPFIVEWSDGVVTQSPDDTGIRWFPSGPGSDATYEVVRATAGDCVARIAAPPIAVSWRPPPEVEKSTLVTSICPGGTGMAELKALPAGAIPQWTVSPGAEILSGQGTSRITFRGAGFVNFRVIVSYPDALCTRETGGSVLFEGEPAIYNLQFSPQRITRFGASVVQFSFNASVKDFAIYLPPERAKDLEPFRCDTHLCRSTYVDTIGLGDPARSEPVAVPLEIRYTGRCDSYERLAS
ncbi:MAG TPA: hypothetical protein VG106_10745, partial [Vicinamibacterales bacterium]|nr:hypothetical protein [Vicinamibacterales bacterium]